MRYGVRPTPHLREFPMPVTRVAVPLLDLHAQYGPLREELRVVVDEVFDRLAFVGGHYVQTLERELAAYTGAAHGVGVSSGTDALLVAMTALGIGPGDEVITSPYTFFATAGCVARLGARCVFVDIDPRTYNIDVDLIEAAITDKTKAIVPVHLFGQCVDMAPLNAIAQRHGVPVIEDAAQAIGARDSDGRMAGSLGNVGCFSFYPSKNLGAAGDGGLITTSDDALAHTMSIMRNHGMEPAYHHEMLGGNFRLDGIQAAVLSVKLKYLDGWAAARQQNAADYREMFSSAGLDEAVGLPYVRPDVTHIYNQFTLRVGAEHRDGLLKHLRSNDIGCALYYPSGCHEQPALSGHGYKTGDFPQTEAAAKECLVIPIYSELTEEHKATVVDTIGEFFSA
jgi:dTDP-4-amino-4,6-dideoxygalactose transaminase